MVVEIEGPQVQVFSLEDHPNIFALYIRRLDTVGFLFQLCEVFLRYSIDISSAEQERQEHGIMAMRFTLHVPSPLNKGEKLESWCRDVEEFVQQCETQPPPNPADPRTLEKLSVTSDLLSVASFHEPADRDLLIDADGSPREHIYELEAKCINQAGVLAYLSLVFFRSGFNIRSVSCGTPKTQNAWLSFVLSTKSLQSSQKLRTFLDIPLEKESSRRSSSFSGDTERWPPGPKMLESVEDTEDEGKLEHHEINLSNGDMYRGQCLKMPNGKRQCGYGIYEYRCETHASYSMYQGQWKDGKKHGNGTLFYRKGGTYVGQWQANDRHGLGVLLTYEESQSTDAMPGFSYEGEWCQDKMHGLGIKESGDSYFYGTFDHGEQGRGVQVSFDSSSRIAGCEVLVPGQDPVPLLDALEEGIASCSALGAGTASPKDDLSPLSQSPLSDKNHDALDLAMAIGSAPIDALIDDGLDSTSADGVECRRPRGDSLESTSWMSSPSRRALPPKPTRQQPCDAPPTRQSSSVAWMASPSAARPAIPCVPEMIITEQGSSVSTRVPEGCFLAPPSPGTCNPVLLPSPGTRSPVARASPSARAAMSPEVEFQLWDMDNDDVLSSPMSDPQVECPTKASGGSAGACSPSSCSRGDSCRPAALQALTTCTPHLASPSAAPLAPRSPKKSGSLRLASPSGMYASPSPTPKGRRAWTPERTGRVRSPKRKKPVKGPMLWSEEELATFLGFLGLSSAVVRKVQSRKIKGLDQLVQMSNSELINGFGLRTHAERLVVRKALKRFLELDRWENAVHGRRLADTMDDPNLREFVVSSKLLTIESEIAQGGFGRVYSGFLLFGDGSTSGQHVALKEMKGDRQVRLHELLKECRVMASLKHNNICQFIGICVDAQRRNGRQYIISELMDCSLFHLVHMPYKLTWNGELTLPLILHISQDICAGIVFLHDMRLVHADLKSPNILIEYKSSRRPIPKICDFGHVAMRTHPAPHHRCGTPHWAAPEVVRQEAIGPPSDVFSCGIILWEMITRTPPHRGLTFGQVAGAVGWAGLLPDIAFVSKVPEPVRRILLHSLSFVPGDRPTAGEMRSELRAFRRQNNREATQLVRGFLYPI